MGDLDLGVEKRDLSISIDDPGCVEAEDVLGRSVRFRQGKGTEEAVAVPASSFVAQAGDLAGG